MGNGWLVFFGTLERNFILKARAGVMVRWSFHGNLERRSTKGGNRRPSSVSTDSMLKALQTRASQKWPEVCVHARSGEGTLEEGLLSLGNANSYFLLCCLFSKYFYSSFPNQDPFPQHTKWNSTRLTTVLNISTPPFHPHPFPPSAKSH